MSKKCKQNILLFTRTMGQGGTENVVLQLCEILKSQKYNVIVGSCGGVNETKLKELGIKHYMFPDITQKSPKSILEVIKQLKHIVKTEHITIIHSHHRMAAFYTELLFRKNVIKVASAHNTFTDKRWLTKFAYHNTHVIAVGESVKENLVSFFDLKRNQISVIHNTVKSFDGNPTVIKEFKEAKDAGYILVGNIGRLSDQKGMSYFIQASVKVLSVCPKTKFFIIGSGELEADLKAQVKKLLPVGTLVFLGYRSDIQNVMSQLDFVVLSSLWEGFPLTPIEAFSVGKTVVATNVDGTPEIVADRKNGLLVKPKDVDGLANAMIEIIEKKDERKQFEAAAYMRYQKKFSFEEMAKKYINFYKQLVGEI